MLEKNISKDFFWALIDRASLMAIQFIALVYLSHLLPPSDFGIIAILGIFINLSIVVIDSGMIGGLIKKADINEIDYDTLFTYNFILSLFIYFILFLIAPIISDYYNNDSLKIILRILSLGVIINGFSLVQTVNLTRLHEFKKQAIITVISQVLTVLISVVLAKKQFGVWSLVSLQISHYLFSGIMLFKINNYKPRFRFSLDSFKEQFAFGYPLLISNILYIINNNVYNSLIGKLYTPIKTGYFYQSNKLQNTPIGIVTAVMDKVVFTTLSKSLSTEELISKGHQLYKKLYIIIIPIFVFVIFNSKIIFIVILGNNWIPAEHIFSILCLSIIPVVIRTFNRILLKSNGRTKHILFLEILITLIGAIILFFTIRKGLIFICYGILISNIITTFISSIILKIEMNYALKAQYLIIIYPLFYSIFFMLLLYKIFDYYEIAPLIKMIIGLILFVFYNLLINYKVIKKLIYENKLKG